MTNIRQTPVDWGITPNLTTTFLQTKRGAYPSQTLAVVYTAYRPHVPRYQSQSARVSNGTCSTVPPTCGRYLRADTASTWRRLRENWRFADWVKVTAGPRSLARGLCDLVTCHVSVTGGRADGQRRSMGSSMMSNYYYPVHDKRSMRRSGVSHCGKQCRAMRQGGVGRCPMVKWSGQMVSGSFSILGSVAR